MQRHESCASTKVPTYLQVRTYVPLPPSLLPSPTSLPPLPRTTPASVDFHLELILSCMRRCLPPLLPRNEFVFMRFTELSSTSVRHGGQEECFNGFGTRKKEEMIPVAVLLLLLKSPHKFLERGTRPPVVI